MAKAKVAPKQYLFVANRDVVIGSTSGHSIRFEKGVAVHVPKVMHKEVLEKGIVPCDAEGKTLDASQIEDPVPEKKVVLAPDNAEERADKIRDVIEAIVKRNNSEDFTAGKVPSAGAVTRALGWKVDAKEIKPVWTAMKEEGAVSAE